MAATRNKNTPGNYKLELESKISNASYQTYEPYVVPNQTNFAGNGLIMGRIGASKLSENSCDIESQLRGIGSTNLVNPQTEITPEINQLKSLNLITGIPLILPEPFVHDSQQRPFRGGNM